MLMVQCLVIGWMVYLSQPLCPPITCFGTVWLQWEGKITVLPQDYTRYVSTALQLWSSFAPPSAARQPPLVVFWVATVRLTGGVTKPWTSRDNNIITCDHSYRCVTKTTTKGLVEELVFISFLRFVCWCQHGVFYFGSWMLYCCFDAWFPVCSVLNSAELLRRSPWSARNRSPAYLFWRVSDCQSWDGTDVQCTGPGGF